MISIRSRGRHLNAPALSSEGPAHAAAFRSRARGLLVAGGVAIVLAVSWYDPALGLLLLVAAGVALFLHMLVVYITDAGLLWPSLAVLGCVCFALCISLPDDFDLRARLEARAPAPVWRVLAPVLQRLVAGGDTVPTRVPSAAAHVPFVATSAGAGAKPHTGRPLRAETSSRGTPAVLPSRNPAVEVGTAVKVVLSGSSPASVAGAPVAFTVAVKRANPGPGAPAGRVDLLDGQSPIASAILTAGNDGSSAAFNISSLAVGDHALRARYRGAAGFARAVSPVLVHVVNPDR